MGWLRGNRLRMGMGMGRVRLGVGLGVGKSIYGMDKY